MIQDLANSIVEANVIADTVQGIARPRIAEIGAGSGRRAHVHTSTQPGTYMIFDIPPALIVSQWYLSRIFPDKKIFAFRTFENFEDIREELEFSDIAFFTSNQIDTFPTEYFDLILSIGTLPEMRPAQVSMYLGLFSRLSSGYIYLKQWRSWKNPLDGTNIKAEDYLIEDAWALVLDRADPINPRFVQHVGGTNSCRVPSGPSCRRERTRRPPLALVRKSLRTSTSTVISNRTWSSRHRPDTVTIRCGPRRLVFGRSKTGRIVARSSYIFACRTPRDVSHLIANLLAPRMVNECP